MKRRKLPPWSRHHEPWCAVFYGKPCDCDDDHRPQDGNGELPGGGAATTEREKEMA